MVEKLGTQHDEHAFERERPTLERLTELTQKGDPLYTRFRSWVSKRAPDRVPQRGESKEEKALKNDRLTGDYLRYLTRIFMPLLAADGGSEPHIALQQRRLNKTEYETRRDHVIRDLPAEYERFQRAVYEARGQAFEPLEELERIQTDQADSLEEWLTRLARYDHYTPAFQYLMWGTIKGLSNQRNGPEGEPRFQTRVPNTVAPLPQFHEAAVGFLEELMLAYDHASMEKKEKALEDVFRESFFVDVAEDAAWKRRIASLLEKNAVNELYASLSALVTDYEEMEGPVEGRWITITKNGIADELTEKDAENWNQESLTKEGDGARMLANISARTPWCLARYSTAERYLNYGKLLVFLENTPKGARPAFGVAFDKNDFVYEARGANDRQELSPRYAETVDERMKKDCPPGWERYQQRLDDARLLAEAERFLNAPKFKPNPPLHWMKPEEQKKYRTYLRAVYELDRKLVGFGYRDNVYAKKMREGRNAMKDARILFGKVAHNPYELDATAGAYVGQLSKEFFKKLDTLPEERLATFRIFTKFPEEPVMLKDIVLGSGLSTGKEFTEAIQQTKDAEGKLMHLVGSAQRMLENEQFTVAKEKILANLTVLSVAQLGLPNGTTYQQIKDAATQKFGLKLCPPEVGPQLRLAYADQPVGQHLIIAMEPITVSGGDRDVFSVGSDEDTRWLGRRMSNPDRKWYADERFVFLRK